MTLSDTSRGQHVVIREIRDGAIRAQALRFGLAEGTVVTCTEKLPSGPVIVRLHRQELALGRALAAGISVAPAGERR